MQILIKVWWEKKVWKKNNDKTKICHFFLGGNCEIKTVGATNLVLSYEDLKVQKLQLEQKLEMEQEKIAQLEEELRTTHLEIKLEQLNVKGKTCVYSIV